MFEIIQIHFALWSYDSEDWVLCILIFVLWFLCIRSPTQHNARNGRPDAVLDCENIPEQAHSRLAPLYKMFVDAAVSIKVILVTRTDKLGEQGTAAALGIVENITRNPPQSFTVESINQLLLELNKLEVMTEFLGDKNISSKISFLRGFLVGQLFEKLSTLLTVNSLRGIFGVSAHKLLEKIGIPPGLNR